MQILLHNLILFELIFCLRSFLFCLLFTFFICHFLSNLCKLNDQKFKIRDGFANAG